MGGLQLSPDGKYVIGQRLRTAATPSNTVVPNYITDSGYAEDINGRSDVGDTQDKFRLALIDVVTGEVK